MRIGVVLDDLMLFSRIDAAAAEAGVELVRVDDPQSLPDDLDLILVDWSARGPHWAETLRGRPGTRIVLFGAHTDLEAHESARAAGLGPMWARSKFVQELSGLVRPR